MKKLALILFLALLSVPAFAQPSPSEIARMLQPQSEQYTFTTTVRRAWGMRLNPAEIGDMYPVNLMYNFHVLHGKLLEHEVFFQNYLFNFGWRRALSRSMEYRVDQFSLSMGFGVPEFLAGGSIQWLSSDLPGNDHGVVFNVGTLMRPEPHLVFALTKRNINQPILGGVAVRGVQSAGIAVRPYADSDRLLYAFEYTLPNGRPLRLGSFKAGIEATLFRNIRAYALVDRSAEFQTTTLMAGIRFYVPYLGFGLNGSFDKLKTYNSSVGTVLFSPEPRGLR